MTQPLFCCIKTTKKIFLCIALRFRTQTQNHGGSRVYHQCEALYITNGLPLYIIIAKEDTACGWWYTRFDEICSSKRMRCTLKRDDMPLLSQWIKKFDKSKLVEFFGSGTRIRTQTYRVRVCCATFTQFRYFHSRKTPLAFRAYIF